MLFFMLHHRIFGETLNLDHSLSHHGSNEAKQIGQNVKLHIKLLPFGAILWSWWCLHEHYQAKLQMPNANSSFDIPLCIHHLQIPFFISGERTRVIIMFFCTDFHLHLRGIRNFYFLFLFRQ